MKFKSTIFFLTSALLVGTSMGTLAQESTEPKMPALLNTAQEIKPVEPSHVMAVVDGKNITAGELDEIAADIDPNLARLPDQQRRLTVLRVYLDMKALSDAALSEGLDKTEDFEKRMTVMRDNVLQQLYFKNEIVDKISDADIQSRYNQEIAALPKVEEVHARHILVKTKEEAEKIIQRLEKGEDFEEIAKKDSTDGSAAMGGDLGYFSRGQMVKPFEDAAFGLKAGEFTKTPVESPFGWHIIKVEDMREKQPPSFEEVKDTMRNMIARDRYLEAIKGLRSKMSVSYPDENVAKMMKKSEQDDSELMDDGSEED
ncbi:peptidylprolyl isomerase [Bartonella tamiae]|uniref:Parvulin-like PPIase n=1 Tax=Bartonella tamiae Th239 TaxID=1094558 RepID=J0R4A6_9HYPH|nr:peptidylprolyl isomerase [Bartonella tamiae]EJF90469.1 hypothetical protein ME5_00870 [Bartonella tamiae Th239]EJF93587.1 hypothetical protein MEG_01011 [Bartonella tamiae Th307]